jgi:hypothetical protein
MPTSSPEHKDIAKQWIDELNPNRVLDIGAGEGTYAMLAKQPHQHWTAIEVFYPYVTTYNLKEKYDEIIVADARYMNYGKIPYQNLIISGDMIEHMTKAESKALIAELLQHTAHLLICFPVVHLDQAPYEGNDFEIHVDHWHFDEMTEFLGDKIVKSLDGEVVAYFLVKGTA